MAGREMRFDGRVRDLKSHKYANEIQVIFRPFDFGLKVEGSYSSFMTGKKLQKYAHVAATFLER